MASLAPAAAADSQVLSGRWDAVATFGVLRVPFTLHFEGQGAEFTAFLLLGESRVRANRATFERSTLRAELASVEELARTTEPRRVGHSASSSPVGGPAGPVRISPMAKLTGAFGNAQTGMHAWKASGFCTCGFRG